MFHHQHPFFLLRIILVEHNKDILASQSGKIGVNPVATRSLLYSHQRQLQQTKSNYHGSDLFPAI